MALLGKHTFPRTPQAAGRARTFTAALLPRHGEDLVDTARLLVSEVVTNALRHTDSDRIVVAVTEHDQTVRVDVTDAGSATSPRVERVAATSERGRGMELVDLLAAAWGVDHTPAGTTVWFELKVS